MKFPKQIARGASLSLLVLLSLGSVARAQTEQTDQAKSYYYPSITTTIVVNKDSTIDVTEQQTFAFTGNFHAAERDISLKNISSITDISVTDVTTGVALTESSARLDILDPGNWGKFAVWNDDVNNSKDVEWYFNLENATHTWAVSYKAHGAIGFDQSYDRLYWNIFSDYPVSVGHADVSVTLPEAVPATNINETYYRTFQPTASGTQPSYANGIFTFAADSFAPNEAYTIDITWPKGVVSEQAFWWDLFYLNLPAITMTAVIFLCLLFLFLWWLFAIKLRERPGNVIPQYEPPNGLLPAIAEAVATEQVTSKGFAATIVDLAVRGFVRIDNDTSAPSRFQGVFRIVMAVLFCGLIGVFTAFTLILIFMNKGAGDPISEVATFVIFAFAIASIILSARRIPKKADYRITAIKDFANDAILKDYEKQYLSLIFSVGDGKSVSTKDFKRLMGPPAQEFYKAITTLRVAIGKEANVETNAFAVFHVKKPFRLFVPAFAIVAYIFLDIFAANWPWAIAISALCTALTVWKVVRMARRTAQGKILHDEWLGFKLYLEVAEKYQLQNLTPDLFEKYLPYAMIFGIEKKWAQVFERASITVPQPQWYGNRVAIGVAGAVTSINAGAAFSATAFSTGFSSSFGSAIASSFGGGAGGGGFAGGGGGGGGGGAR